MSSLQGFKIIEKINSLAYFGALWRSSYNFSCHFFSIPLLKTPHERKTLDKNRKLLTTFFVGAFDRNQKTLYKCKKLLTNAKNFIQKMRWYCIKFLNYPVIFDSLIRIKDSKKSILDSLIRIKV